MKIASSELQMAASHAKQQKHEVKESLRMWVGERRPNFEGEPRTAASSPLPAQDLVKLSEQGRKAQANEAEAIENSLDQAENDPRMQLIRAMIAALTGREVRVFDAKELDVKTSASVEDPNAAAQANAAANAETPRSAGYGIEYDRHESYSESENTSFAANGTIRTADGKEINFSLSLSMSRNYHEESDTAIRLGDARQKKDPLVLNFSGTAAQLTDQRFSFDLDADGSNEEIHFVAGGSGFLALDRNNDGRINNGSELFGARTGNGFAELAALDGDRNGWIDENDAAFDQLSVWTRDAGGQDKLLTLREANVGALALASVATPFDIKDGANNLKAQIRSSGVFLQETGQAGTMQQVDLTV